MTKEFKIIDDMSKCTGCAACANLCPVLAIEMVRNAEGFEFPKIDFDKCVYCKKCIVQCPINLPEEVAANPLSEFIIGRSADVEVLKQSSSGGIFSEVALNVLESGGAVCGAAFDENNELRHILISQKEDLKKLRGSKYLQSRIGDAYKQMRPLLLAGTKVLFVGTPCQVAGVRSFFSRFPKQLANLYCIDVLCHSVPSPTVFAQYLKEICAEKPSNITFRDKTSGWANYSLKISGGHRVLYHKPVSEEPFLRAFLSDIFSREACQGCRYTRLEREGDITLGDFWGAEKVRPDLDHRAGTSLIMINSAKGRELFNGVKDGLSVFDAITRDDALKSNMVLYSPMEASPKRSEFFDRWLRKKEPLIPLMRELSRKSDKGFWGKLNKGFAFLKSQFCARRWYAEPEDLSKKVGILNLSYGNHNFGAMLVSYSMQVMLRKLGYVPYILNFNPSFKSYWRLSYVRGLIAGMNFVKFRYSFLNTTRLYPTARSLRKANREMDTFMFGSDQVWRYAISKENCGAYFGEFAADGKRLISYAASFGKDRWDEAPADVTQKMATLLKRFAAVSVREDSGIEICKDVFGVEAEHVLDPTLLLTEADYATIYTNASARARSSSKTPFIACAYLDGSALSADIVSSAAATLGCETKNILHREIRIFGKTKPIYHSVPDWLQMIRSSQLIITDSFHCVAFSIIFEKPFVCLPSSHRGNSRLESLLKMLGISDRMLCSADDLEKVLASGIDYVRVRESLDAFRKQSFAFLRNALKDPIPPFGP